MVIKCILRNRAAAENFPIFKRTTTLSWCGTSASPAERKHIFYLFTQVGSDVENPFDGETVKIRRDIRLGRMPATGLCECMYFKATSREDRGVFWAVTFPLCYGYQYCFPTGKVESDTMPGLFMFYGWNSLRGEHIRPERIPYLER